MAKDHGVQTMKKLVQSIGEQLGLICGDEKQVCQDCAEFSQLLSLPPSTSQQLHLKDLAELLTQCDDNIVLPVYELLVEVVQSQQKPWPLLKLLLNAREDSILEQAIELTLALVSQGQLPLGRGILRELARLMDLEYSPFEDEELFELLNTTMRNQYEQEDGNGLLDLFRKDPEDPIRLLAARLLDYNGAPASPEAAQDILGGKAYKTLAPLLDYTRATYKDLYALSGGRRVAHKVVDLFKNAERQHGHVLVREAVAAFGWSKVSLGIKIEHLLEVTLPGNLPLMVSPHEALLFDGTEAATGGDVFLITAHGGSATKQDRDRKKRDPVDRFRRLNITHAELLGDILDVAPLDKEKVSRICASIDSVVESYEELFSAVSDECSILPDVWQTLRDQVMQYLKPEANAGPLSAELTRLVLAFEEPGNLGEVRTVHGLKRYLHQKGLKLGFEMVDTDHASNRTVDLLLLGKDGRQMRLRTIRYAEFEGGAEKNADPWLPYPVKVVADGLSRQLLYGTENFPGVDIFIFGNEVHYYITFRNHPAFLRVDFSPPQRGGMLDLEYYGVSNYELDVHPNLNLDAIRILYRKLEFDVKIEGTRLFVRYDKERSNSLGDLCDHVASLFRLAPFLMDFDWVIGSLQLSKAARKIVAGQWAERFCKSGVLPLNDILNEKRNGVLISCSDGPTGKEEVIWNGCLPYDDRFSRKTRPEFWDQLWVNLNQLGLHSTGFGKSMHGTPWPLLELEKSVLSPVREAFKAGQIEYHDQCLHPVQTDRFQPIHEADFFAVLLAGDPEQVAAAGMLARPLSELERFIVFTPTGFVGSLVVERARVTVRGGELTVYAARDVHGVIRMGVFTVDSRLVRQRKSLRSPWQTNANLDAGILWELMRSANYLASGPPAVQGDSAGDLAELKKLASLRRPVANIQPIDGESILNGLKAAPGRAVGRVVFGTKGRKPKELRDAILVAREVRPADNQFLSRSAGIISTGGAVLSHAALLAIQFGKPALVAEAQWNESGPAPSLSFAVTEFRERERQVEGVSVCVRTVVGRRTDKLIENDLIILDANEGMVHILGQQRDTLALWDGLQLLGEASSRAAGAATDKEILEIRAQQLRARHQIQKILDRLVDPVLTAFAVEEFVVGETLAPVKHADKQRLLARILANDRVADSARKKLEEISLQLADRCRSAEQNAKEQIPSSGFLYEVLGLRLAENSDADEQHKRVER